MEIEEHYHHLLGIQSPWQVSDVDLGIQENRVDIEIEYTDDVGLCPECGAISLYQQHGGFTRRPGA